MKGETAMLKKETTYENRKFVYMVQSLDNTTAVYNLDASNAEVNSFLWLFDVWGCNGHFSLCSDEKHQMIKFDCSKEFYDLVETRDFKIAFKRMNVEVVKDFSFVEKLF